MLCTNWTSQTPSTSMLTIQGTKGNTIFSVSLMLNCNFLRKSICSKYHIIWCMCTGRRKSAIFSQVTTSNTVTKHLRKNASSNYEDYEAGLKPHEAKIAGMRSWHIPTCPLIWLIRLPRCYILSSGRVVAAGHCGWYVVTTSWRLL